MSLTVKVPLRVPATVGLNVTWITQLADAANEAEQLLLCAKCPVTWMPVILNAALPVFVRVTTCAVLVVPTCWPVKVTLAGEIVAIGAREAEPVPLRVTD